MSRLNTVLLCLSTLCLLPVSGHGETPQGWALSLSAGNGGRGQEHDAYRVGVQRHWERRWWQRKHFHLTGYWDASVALFDASGLRGGPADDGAGRIWAASVSPVLRWQFEPLRLGHIAPFFELGVGISYLSDTRLRSGKIRSYPLGSHFQFEDRGVVGIRFGNSGRWELAYQRMHYSNLNLASDNNGVDTHLGTLRYRF